MATPAFGGRLFFLPLAKALRIKNYELRIKN
jgi:hypothetical protein